MKSLCVLFFIIFIITINGLSNVRSRLKNTVAASRKHHSSSSSSSSHRGQHLQKHKKYVPHHFINTVDNPLVPDDLGESCSGNGKHGNCMTEDDCSSLNDGKGGEIFLQHTCADTTDNRRCCLWWWALTGSDTGSVPCGDSSHGQCVHLQDECESRITQTAVECQADQTCCIIPHQPHNWGPFLMNDSPCYHDTGSGRCMIHKLKCPSSVLVDSPDCPDAKCCIETPFEHDPTAAPHSVNIDETMMQTRVEIGKLESERIKDTKKIEAAFPVTPEPVEEDKTDDEVVVDSKLV